MKERILFLIIALALVLSGCTATMTTNQEGSPAASETGGGPVTAGHGRARTPVGEARVGAPPGPLLPGMAAEYMDRQEKELQTFTFATSPTIRRDKDYVLITFYSDSLFAHDSTDLTAEASKEVHLVAEMLERYPQTRVRVNGFTDSIGSERLNLALSQKRATAVRDALVRSGINPDRIRARGFGENKPLRSNATDSGRKLNRRVTLVIIPDRS